MLDLIIDLGAHDGGNLPYYLRRAKRVVAVEANPALATSISQQFVTEISSRRLSIIDRVIKVDDDESESVRFFVNQKRPGLSHIATESEVINSQNTLSIKCIRPEELFLNHGCADYLKIDLEGYDEIILDWLCKNPKYWPAYISFERVKLSALEKFLKESPYRYFNMVSFYNFRNIYGARKGKTAGPFGSDIQSPWVEAEELLEAYKAMPYHWFDIHAGGTLPEGRSISAFDIRWYEMPLELKIKRRFREVRMRLGNYCRIP